MSNELSFDVDGVNVIVVVNESNVEVSVDGNAATLSSDVKDELNELCTQDRNFTNIDETVKERIKNKILADVAEQIMNVRVLRENESTWREVGGNDYGTDTPRVRAGSEESEMTNGSQSSVDNPIFQSTEGMTAAGRLAKFDATRREEERRTPSLETVQKEDLDQQMKKTLDVLPDKVRTRTKDVSRMNPNIHPTVDSTQKTLRDIQNDMTKINKVVEALLKTPEAEKFWRKEGRYKKAFPLEQRTQLLQQRMIIPGEAGADQSVELQYAPEYIKKRLKALETPMGKQTKEYKDLVAIQKEVKALIKVIKDPRTTGEKIYDAVLTTCFAVGKLALGVVAIGVAAGAIGVVAGAAGGLAGTVLAIAVVVGVTALLVKTLQWSHQNIVSPAWQGLKNGFNSLSENQAKFRILSNILPYEPTEFEPNNSKLATDEALKLANNMEQTLVLYEVFESSEPRKELGEHNTVDYDHLKTIIDLKHVAGLFSDGEVDKYIKDPEGYLTYEEEVIIPQFKKKITDVLGEDKVKFNASERTGRVSIAYLDESTKEALRKVVPKVWKRFNDELKAAQNELLSTVRAQFKTGDMLGRNKRHMTLGTYNDAVEVARKASGVIHDLNPTTGERLSSVYKSSNLENARAELVALEQEFEYLNRSQSTAVNGEPEPLNNGKKKLTDKIEATKKLVGELETKEAAKIERQQAQAAAPSFFQSFKESWDLDAAGTISKLKKARAMYDEVEKSLDNSDLSDEHKRLNQREARSLRMEIRNLICQLEAKGKYEAAYGSGNLPDNEEWLIKKKDKMIADAEADIAELRTNELKPVDDAYNAEKTLLRSKEQIEASVAELEILQLALRALQENRQVIIDRQKKQVAKLGNESQTGFLKGMSEALSRWWAKPWFERSVAAEREEADNLVGYNSLRNDEDLENVVLSSSSTGDDVASVVLDLTSSSTSSDQQETRQLGLMDRFKKALHYVRSSRTNSSNDEAVSQNPDQPTLTQEDFNEQMKAAKMAVTQAKEMLNSMDKNSNDYKSAENDVREAVEQIESLKSLNPNLNENSERMGL